MDQDLIKLVNKLQDTFANLGGELDMPQLVVVGSQSAGKSSVLETIVGRDFLPRGQGIVTRRPLVLQLIHTPTPTEPSASNQPNEWAQFLHIDKRFTDYGEIRKEIEQETFRVAGQNKGVSKLPISLRIYSPDVLDLTLVDLPGLTKIPVGDQPSDIERQIRNLILDYISKPNSVILAVSPANVDLANSESLKLARSVDQQGRRTIGVLTKLDLMDAGTNALDILTGRVYPLKLGFIGVVNRSQQDINSEKELKYALESETEFFKNHPAYRNIAHKNGTKYLAKTLNQVLMNHIREKLPDMKARLNTLMGQAQQELVSFGDAAIFGDQNQQGALILRLMTQFARDFISSIEGTKIDVSTKELSGGARIYYIFNDIFGHALGSIDSTANLGDQDIRTAIRNSTGPRPSLFVPEQAFDLLVKPQIKLLEAPSLRCVELVYEELVKICHNCTSAELQRFPKLHQLLIETVSELLRERLGPTSDYAQSLIEIQTAYINTNHPAFVAGSAVAAQQASVGGMQKPAILPRARTSSVDLSNGLIDSESESDSSVNNSTPGAGVLHDRETSDSASVLLNGASGSGVSLSGGAGSVSDKRGRHAALHHPNLQTIRSSSPLRQPASMLNGRSSSKQRGGSTGSLTAAGSLYAQQQRPPSASGSVVGAGAESNARDTFLGYFFGAQNGNGMGAGAGGARNPTLGMGANGFGGLAPVGRDMSGMSTPGSVFGGGGVGGTGANAGSGGSNAAYDMKSLGRHIEALPLDGPLVTRREDMETRLIRSLIASYFGIVRQTIQDIVPKAIMHLLVNHASQHVQNRLVASLYRPENFSEMLNEDEGLVLERERVKKMLDAYKDAFKILSDVGVKSG